MKRTSLVKRFSAVVLSGILAAVLPLSVFADDTMEADSTYELTAEGSSDSDYTEWSYVYFGSYPQSEVTDDTLKAEINNTISGNGIGKNLFDVTVNGDKYRRLGWDDVDDEEDGTFWYYKWEPIKWRVLRVDETNGTLFLCADRALEYLSSFRGFWDDTDNWNTSMIRKWLNGEDIEDSYTIPSFITSAFNDSESKAILETTNRNIVYSFEGSWFLSDEDDEYRDDSSDRVFLLSAKEVLDPDLGFCSEDGTDSGSRIILPTDYSARGLSSESSSSCEWWLRSSVKVKRGGDENDIGYYIHKITGEGKCYHTAGIMPMGDARPRIVPALKIKFSSDRWSVSESGGSDGRDTVKNPVYHAAQAKENKTPEPIITDDSDNLEQGKKQESDPKKQGNETVVVKGASYQVTGDGTATYNGPKSKSKTSYTVPATVKINGKTRKVTVFDTRSMKGCSKMKSLTVGKNVTRIVGKGLNGKKKLKKVTINSKMITKVDKGALKNLGRGAKIYLPKSMKSKYKKIFKKSVIGNAKIVWK